MKMESACAKTKQKFIIDREKTKRNNEVNRAFLLARIFLSFHLYHMWQDTIIELWSAWNKNTNRKWGIFNVEFRVFQAHFQTIIAVVPPKNMYRRDFTSCSMKNLEKIREQSIQPIDHSSSNEMLPEAFANDALPCGAKFLILEKSRNFDDGPSTGHWSYHRLFDHSCCALERNQETRRQLSIRSGIDKLRYFVKIFHMLWHTIPYIPFSIHRSYHLSTRRNKEVTASINAQTYSNKWIRVSFTLFFLLSFNFSTFGGHSFLRTKFDRLQSPCFSTVAFL